MQHKTLATNISVIMLLFLIVITGATLSSFVVQKRKVEVLDVNVICPTTFSVLNEDDELIEDGKLEIKSSSIGIRPCTGKEDSVTDVPITVNDTVGTEGGYCCFKLNSEIPYKIVLVACEITKGFEKNSENVKIAILDDKTPAINSSDIGGVLSRGESAREEELLLVVWLDADTTEDIAGAKINITIAIVPD